MTHGSLDNLEPELLELFAAACTGTATIEQNEQLATRLRDDDAAMQAYVIYMATHSELAWRYREDSTAEPGVVPTPTTSRRQGMWSTVYDIASDYITLSLLISAITMAIIVLSMGLIKPRMEPATDSATAEFIAKVTKTQGATWDQSSAVNLMSTSILPGDRLILRGGLAEITFENGAVVTLEGPAELEASKIGRSNLHLGRLTANVPQRAIGFTIETAHVVIKDLGTEFAVEVLPDGSDRVFVKDGRVLCTHRDGVQSFELTTGEQLLASTSQLDRDVRSELDDRFAWNISAQPDRHKTRDVHYTFEGNAHDSLGAAHGTVGAGVEFTTGHSGQGVRFAAVTKASDLVVIPKRIAFDPGSENFSICFWVRRDGDKCLGVLDALPGGDIGYQIGFRATPGNPMGIRLDDTAGNDVIFEAQTSVTDTERFHHYAFVIDRQRYEAKLYIDGKLDATADISMLTGEIHPGHDLVFGSKNSNNGLNGHLDELNFYASALSPAEVADLAQSEQANDKHN